MSVLRLRHYNMGNAIIRHYWRFEGNANDSAGSAGGTLVNTPVQVTGKLGNAYSFNGVDQYINIPDAIQIGQSFSVFLWAKSNVIAWEDLGFMISSRVANGFIIGPSTGFADVRCYVGDAGGNVAAVNGAIANPADITLWHQYGFTYDHSTALGTLKCYLDGQLVTTVSPGTKISRNADTVPATIGRDYGLTGADRFGNCVIDEVAIWSGVLTSDQILYNYNSGAGRIL